MKLGSGDELFPDVEAHVGAGGFAAQVDDGFGHVDEDDLAGVGGEAGGDLGQNFRVEGAGGVGWLRGGRRGSFHAGGRGGPGRRQWRWWRRWAKGVQAEVMIRHWGMLWEERFDAER